MTNKCTEPRAVLAVLLGEEDKSNAITVSVDTHWTEVILASLLSPLLQSLSAHETTFHANIFLNN